MLMSLVSLIPMIYNYLTGEALGPSADTFQQIMTKFTIGNQKA